MTEEDPRKTALKKGLRQLNVVEIKRLITHMERHEPVLLDRDEDGCANYSMQRGAYCPLAVAVDVHALLGVRFPDDETVREILTDELGLKIYNTRGVKGEFYTTNRWQDLMTAAKEVLDEKRPWTNWDG